MRLKHVICLRRPAANSHHQKLPVKIGLSVSKVAISTPRTRCVSEDDKQLGTPEMSVNLVTDGNFNCALLEKRSLKREGNGTLKSDIAAGQSSMLSYFHGQ
ncbi:hypothetical protein CEXT_334131 [Caerostris extrusa]|uniref:Uncharacterized protein n=1 Tax=Caerostris extrusa TaxID=172846 RepID=A0AAV4XZ22_CAEEX|nr:hypothetical protein CEXT_334131 [Caerostris extrusa]